MSTGGVAKNQFATTGDGNTDGGNSSGGKSMRAPTLHQPGNMMGRSGTPDNQSTNRPKGST